MSFPKIVNLNPVNAGAVKVTGAIGVIAVAAQVYSETGDWKLSVAALAFSLLSGNVVGTRRD